MASPRLVPVLAAWTERDRGRAIHPSDHAAIEKSEAARALVLDLFEVPARERDLYSACARLGRLLAEGGASPSLAAGTIDEAAAALSSAGEAADAARIAAARSSLVEGYVGAVREIEHAAMRETWAYPRCIVPIGPDTIAIACGHPPEDAAALEEWAANVATRATKAKVRRAVLSGNERACAAVTEALALVGIEIVAAGAEESAPRARTRWLRLPWQK